jgi:hypothetical protein
MERYYDSGGDDDTGGDCSNSSCSSIYNFDYGTFVGVVAPPSLLQARTAYHTDMYQLTQAEQEQFWLVDMPISFEHNWGQDERGQFRLYDDSVYDYDPDASGNPLTADMKAGSICEQWISKDGTLMAKARFHMDDSDLRIRMISNGLHAGLNTAVRVGIAFQLSLTHTTDYLEDRFLLGGYTLMHTPVELTVTKAGYRCPETGYSASCGIYCLDGVDDLPDHLRPREKKTHKELTLPYKRRNCREYSREERSAYGFLPTLPQTVY